MQCSQEQVCIMLLHMGTLHSFFFFFLIRCPEAYKLNKQCFGTTAGLLSWYRCICASWTPRQYITIKDNAFIHNYICWCCIIDLRVCFHLFGARPSWELSLIIITHLHKTLYSHVTILCNHRNDWICIVLELWDAMNTITVVRIPYHYRCRCISLLLKNKLLKLELLACVEGGNGFSLQLPVSKLNNLIKLKINFHWKLSDHFQCT